MTKGICEREDKKADVTYFIRYQLDGTDIKGRLGKSRAALRARWRRRLLSRGLVLTPNRCIEAAI